jgi:hypothetical protein
MKFHQQIRRTYPVSITFKAAVSIVAVVIGLISTKSAIAQGVLPNQPPPAIDVTVALLIIGLLVLVLILPVGYLLLRRSKKYDRSLLLVSTDESIFPMVKKAAQRYGYYAITVYRYEDALDKLRNDITVQMIIVDDSVPQYEAGLLLSMLQRLPIGIRPLILIHDSSELGQTAPSYRAEAVVAQPVTEKALESAIRQVSERIEIVF